MDGKILNSHGATRKYIVTKNTRDIAISKFNVGSVCDTTEEKVIKTIP